MQRNAHRGLTVHCKVHGLWLDSCIFQYPYSTIAPSSYHGLGYWWSLDFARPSPLTMWHNQYVLVMVDKFSKWIQLVLLLNKSNKRVAYAFLDQVFNQSGAPTEVPMISCSSQNQIVQNQIFWTCSHYDYSNPTNTPIRPC
jgi:hypothetical protein